MGKIEKIRQKIKELRELLEDHNYYLDNPEQALGYGLALDDMEKFLDTLSEEPDKSLEEEMNLWISENENIHHGDKLMVGLLKDIARYFAEWQKSQMLKDAVEGTVHANTTARWVEADVLREDGFICGDKVKVIVLKAEEE